MFFTLTKGTKNIEEALNIRKQVFVEELGISIDKEHDENDKTAYHLVLFHGIESIAVGRILLKNNTTASFGRIAVKKNFRGQGYGGQLLIKMMDCAKNKLGVKLIELNAQLDAIDFYKKYGFKSYGIPFTEVGIKHQCMIIEKEDFKNIGL